MSTVETRYCYRHPDRETGLSCSECGRPVCADCANFAPVGIRCPDHAGVRRTPATRLKPRPVRRAPGTALATNRAPVTYTLIAVNVLIYLVAASQASSLYSPGSSVYQSGSLYNHTVLFGPYVAHGDWWRLVTSMFLHYSLLHIGFNMYALWAIGRLVEQYLGTARYIGLYFVSGLAGSAGALLQTPHTPVLGASGAIFGILGAMMVIEWQVTEPRRPGYGPDRDQPRHLVPDPGHLLGRARRRADRRDPRHARLRPLERPRAGAVRATRARRRAGAGRRGRRERRARLLAGARLRLASARRLELRVHGDDAPRQPAQERA